MSKNTSPSGLLSRMAKFVKNSATGWSDLDQLDSRQDASDTRQALKDMIERKRRNDASRRDEFETLRKIRRGEVAKNKSSSSDAGPSSYLNSAPPDAVRPHRARTLERKIDQIEEQMAQAWFKKPRNDAAPEPQAPPPEPAPHAPPAVENTAFAATVPMSHLPEGVVEVVPPSMEDEHDTLVDAPATKAEEPPTHADAPHEHVPHATGEDRDAYTFGIMGDFNVEVSAEMPQDAELEESAIRFANGDAAGAEESLRAQLSGEILDDPTAILAPIRERLGDARYVELNCRFVLRVDFAAAGMLLNWAADLQAQEKKVAFTNLNRLIALFFGVVGIPEVARVSPRQD